MKKLIYLIFIGMAISCKKDQPIIFTDDFDCLPCASGYCTPVEVGDTSQIQVDLTELTENIITNGTFASGSGWTVGADWTISGGTANYNGTFPATSISRDCDVELVEGYYLVKLDMIIIANGTADFGVSLGGVSVSTIGGLIPTAPFISQTLYLFAYITPSNNTLSISGANYDVSIDNVEVYLLSSAIFDIKHCDSDTVFYSEDDGSSVEYYETGDITGGDDVPTITQGYGIITLDWTDIDLDEGCYCLCVKDGGLIGFEYIQNGGFDSEDNWTIVNTGLDGWEITGGQAVHNSEGAGSYDGMYQTLNTFLTPGLNYILSFDVIDATSWQVFYQINSASYAGDTPVNGSGNTSVSVTIAGGILGEPVERITLTVSNVNDSILDNVSLVVDPDSLPCTTSNCISLKESWDTWASTRKMCNILVTGSNDNSAFGFASDYDFSGRIFGVIRNGSYPDIENTEYKDLTGLKSIQYNDNEKFKELQVYQVPSGVHDWLRLALRCQDLTLTINGTEKSFIKKPGDYTPNWRKSSPEAPVIVEIQEVQQVSSMARNV